MEVQVIRNKIYEIRGRQVMLDRDLAELYGVTTGALNQAVKRNLRRFPEDFMFRLTPDEFSNLKSHFVISSWGGVRKMPFVFTEQGIAMLSGLLNSDVAINANIAIMRAFVTLRQLAMTSLEVGRLAQENHEIRRLLEEFVEETEGKFDDVYVALSQLAIQRQSEASKPRRKIGFIREDED